LNAIMAHSSFIYFEFEGINPEASSTVIRYVDLQIMHRARQSTAVFGLRDET
jgi:hypothetical protein